MAALQQEKQYSSYMKETLKIFKQLSKKGHFRLHRMQQLTNQPTKLQKLWSATTPQLDEWKAVDSVLDWFDKSFLDHQRKMIALFSETSYLVAKMIVMMTILPQMLPISSQSLNGANSAARRAAEGLEKLNHQNLTPKIMSKSNPVHLWRFGRTKALKIQ